MIDYVTLAFVLGNTLLLALNHIKQSSCWGISYTSNDQPTQNTQLLPTVPNSTSSTK